MKKCKKYLTAVFISLLIFSCRDAAVKEEVPEAEPQTPVTVTSISTEGIAEWIELNATSTFLQKSYVKASSNGYISSVNTQLGKYITAGQNLFSMKTKEAHSIGNSINVLDSSFKFSGIINIKASEAGYIAELNHQQGDYVQEGEQLAVISNMNSFAFILNLPYELRPYVLSKNTVELTLPDGKRLTGTIASVMPLVDSASQTQNIVIRVNEMNLPINLIAKVRVPKVAKSKAVSLPRQAVLSDETQTNYWVMKVIDSITAVKVPIVKGIETTDRIEILSPPLSLSDKFLLTGNYGLPDTAKIKIVQ